MMDSTLAQLLNHIYDVEAENKLLKEFIQANEGVLKRANVAVPGMESQSESPQGE